MAWLEQCIIPALRIYTLTADCLEADAGSEVEEWEVQAQLDELSHQLLSASYSHESSR